ncbi:MAG TPA: hypothetical protein VFA35_09440, partial [Burkholderiaceae bacterium]|nr:hypothetical protein [Burkholderiaceae bacterium]
MLQRFERSEAPTHGLQRGAAFAEPGAGLVFLAGELLVPGLALVEHRGEGFDLLAMFVVVGGELFRRRAQRGEIGGLLFRAQRFEAAADFHRLAIEIVEARAFDFGGLARIGAGLGMLVPLRLPLRERGLGGVLCFGSLLGGFAQRFELRLAVEQRGAQRLDLLAIGRDMLAEFGIGIFGF